MGLSGAAALIYEIISSKFFSYFFGSDTYSVSTMLSAFLLGIALGSLLMSKFINRIENKRRLFAILQFSIGAYALIFLTNLKQFPILLSFFYSFSGSSLFLITLSKFLAGLLYLLFPTILLGACFPLAGSLLIKRIKRVGIDVGTLYSLDTFGAILGACVAGFILMPMIGLRLTCLIGALLNFGSGLLILEKKFKNFFIFSTGCLILLVLFSLFPMSISPTAYLMNSQFGQSSIPKEQESNSGEISLREKIIFEKNTAYGLVSVTETEGQKGNKIRHLMIDGRDQCFTSTFSSEKAISHLALANFEKPIAVLNIGLGCGFSLDAILKHENVKTVDVVEINPVVREVAEKYFSEDNHHALRDRRVNLIIDDATHFLMTKNRRYDAIIVDVERPSIPHSSPLYTVEYFQIIAERLNKEGVFGLWAYFSDYKYLRDAYYSIKEAFPYVYLTLKFQDIPIFIASKTRINVTGLKKNLDNYPNMKKFTEFENELMQKFKNDTNYNLSTLDNPILEYFDAERIRKSDFKWKPRWEQQQNEK